ncbi:hypothetical protein UY3_14668 [Chelonia mydas]|uniref:Uncharacterized protein n=1 Tax=Chelonia mydas TaxID=8469 RepID=M7BIY4_CHEMY|nr:hypothetical protein UY3_14668 [Chelonia mydas]
MQLLWFTPAKGLAFCHCGLAGISVFVVFSFRLPREESYQTKGTRAKMAKGQPMQGQRDRLLGCFAIPQQGELAELLTMLLEAVGELGENPKMRSHQLFLPATRHSGVHTPGALLTLSMTVSPVWT